MPLPFLGRSQEVVFMILQNLGKFKAKIVIEEQLRRSWNLCMNYHNSLRDEFNNAKSFLRDISKLEIVRTDRARDQIITSEGSAVILSLDSPRLNKYYTQRLKSDARNLLLFSGYQPPGAIGRTLQSRSREGSPDNLEQAATIKHIELRTHPDILDTLRLIRSMKRKPTSVYTFHGEGSRCMEMATSIENELGIPSRSPTNLDEIRF